MVLTKISWSIFQALLVEMGDHRALRLACSKKIAIRKVCSKIQTWPPGAPELVGPSSVDALQAIRL
jgi:hypothetical protein